MEQSSLREVVEETRRLAEERTLIENSERVHETVHDLAARWHRVEERLGETSLAIEKRNFQAGMQAGWEQAISMLTGVPYGDVHFQLRDGRL